MGFSLTKEHLDRLREKLHVIDELHARAGGVEPVDPKETFFEALKKRKANLSRSQISEEDILVKLQENDRDIANLSAQSCGRLQKYIESRRAEMAHIQIPPLSIVGSEKHHVLASSFEAMC